MTEGCLKVSAPAPPLSQFLHTPAFMLTYALDMTLVATRAWLSWYFPPAPPPNSHFLSGLRHTDINAGDGMADCPEEQEENKLRKEKASKRKDQWALPDPPL